MRFEAIGIDENSLYNFFIGTKEKPDSDIEDLIKEQIRAAMEALGREPGSYSVIIGQADREEPEESPFPSLGPGSDYILFAIRRSSRGEGYSAESMETRDLLELQKQWAKMIIPPEDSRIALVLLQDCSLGVIISGRVPIVSIVSGYDRATPSRRSSRYRRS